MPVKDHTTIYIPTALPNMPVGNIAFEARMIHSSNVEWIAWPKYDEVPIMLVQFKGGSRYAYIGVSRQRAVACAYARSSGNYLAAKIKPHFKVMRLR